MSNKNINDNPAAAEKEVDSLSGLQEKVASNQKTIMWVCVALTAVIAIILIYIFAIRRPGTFAP